MKRVSAAAALALLSLSAAYAVDTHPGQSEQARSTPSSSPSSSSSSFNPAAFDLDPAALAEQGRKLMEELGLDEQKLEEMRAMFHNMFPDLGDKLRDGLAGNENVLEDMFGGLLRDEN